MDLPPPPDLAPGEPAGGGRRRRGWRVGRSGVVALVLCALVLVVVGPLVFGWWQFSRIERIDVGPVLQPAAVGTNYLVVGSDSRALVDPASADADAFLAGPVAGERADTIIVLRVGDGPARMLSIPRDLWVTYPSTGEEGRINGAFAQGPGELIATVEGLGIPISHYLQIDFTSFAGLVDAVGGVTLDFPHPAYDEMSGLAVDTAGRVTLDGTQAVAYVRSRQYTEIIDGAPVTDPTGDIGRTARQRAFLAALFSRLGGTRNPFSVASAATAVAPGLAIDDTMTFLDALRLAWDVRNLSSESVELPVDPFTTSGGAAVLSLRQPDAGTVLAGFG